MKRRGEAPSPASLVIMSIFAFLIALFGIVMGVTTLLFTMFGAHYFPERWTVAILCGFIPALVGGGAFLTGLRLHDLGARRGALIASALSLLGLPLLAGGFAYLLADWRP